MRSKIGILYVLLALVLTVTNVAASGHASSHNAASSETCSLCVHATGNCDAIIDNITASPVIPSAVVLESHYAALPALAARLHDHPSRAPPFTI
jgi:hypothetical protein